MLTLPISKACRRFATVGFLECSHFHTLCAVLSQLKSLRIDETDVKFSNTLQRLAQRVTNLHMAINNRDKKVQSCGLDSQTPPGMLSLFTSLTVMYWYGGLSWACSQQYWHRRKGQPVSEGLLKAHNYSYKNTERLTHLSEIDFL